MYAVIFRATAAKLDQQYSDTAAQLRQLAFDKYHCQGFHSACEDGLELAISYWNSLEDIQAWKQDPLHLQAQQAGRNSWYQDYSVEVVEVLRHYQSSSK